MAIVSSNPPNGAIDARQPSDPFGVNPTGWTSIALTMTGNPGPLTASDFTVIVPSGTAPNISGLTVNGTTVTLNLSTFIPPGKWTKFTHNCSGTSKCLGYLPADGNNDTTSAPVDILDLIDNLNGVYTPPMQIWQCDTDRSNLCAPADILKLIDLLNGASGYNVWNGVTIGQSPCGGSGLLAMGGGSSSDEFDSRFADSFVTYLTTAAPADPVAEAEFVAVVEGLTAWCTVHCSGNVRSAIVVLLQGESLQYKNELGPKLASEIIGGLSGGE